MEIDGNQLKEITTDDGRVILQIANASGDDAGEYTVIASNDLGESASSSTLSVLGKCEMIKLMQVVSVKIRMTTTIINILKVICI